MSTPTPPGDGPNDPNQPGYGQQPGQPGPYGQPGGQAPGQPGGYPQYPGGPGGAPAPGGGYGYGAPQQNNAKTLAIIGIVCIFICSPAAIILGFIAQGKYREVNQPDTLAKVAWIGGIVSLVLGVLVNILARS